MRAASAEGGRERWIANRLLENLVYQLQAQSRMISLVTRSGRIRLAAVAALPWCVQMSAQTLLSSGSGPVHLVGSDLAVLEAQDVRKEINCSVTPDKPSLGFDLRYHAGFTVTVPLKELAGEENSLTILFRVTPEGQAAEPAYFIQRYTVPSI